MQDGPARSPWRPARGAIGRDRLDDRLTRFVAEEQQATRGVIGEHARNYEAASRATTGGGQLSQRRRDAAGVLVVLVEFPRPLVVVYLSAIGHAGLDVVPHHAVFPALREEVLAPGLDRADGAVNRAERRSQGEADVRSAQGRGRRVHRRCPEGTASASAAGARAAS